MEKNEPNQNKYDAALAKYNTLNRGRNGIKHMNIRKIFIDGTLYVVEHIY